MSAECKKPHGCADPQSGTVQLPEDVIASQTWHLWSCRSVSGYGARGRAVWHGRWAGRSRSSILATRALGSTLANELLPPLVSRLSMMHARWSTHTIVCSKFTNVPVCVCRCIHMNSLLCGGMHTWASPEIVCMDCPSKGNVCPMYTMFVRLSETMHSYPLAAYV